jgi:RNA polymerase sigma-70 factor, ECF subfamily
MADHKSTSPILGHEEERFLQAFEEYNDALFRHALSRLSDREKAIDVVHDTYTKVWMYIKNGQKIESFRPFLYKVLNNLIIDTYRKQREMSLDALLAQDGVDEGSFDELSETTTEALAATIDGRQAFGLLHTLPDVYREVLILRFVDELGPREISQLIEESENVVSVRIHRGLKMLRDTMHKEMKTREEMRIARTGRRPQKKQ